MSTPGHPPLRRVLRGVRMTARAETPAHADLRGRLMGLTLLTILLDLAAAGVAWAVEHDRGEVTTFGNALFWTTTQMLTVSSQFPNPLSTAGKVLDVGLEIYSITVVTALAGAFASFFHRRSGEHETSAPGPR